MSDTLWDRLRSRMLQVAEALLSGKQWFRRWRGGHWERWYFGDPANCWHWIPYICCTRETGGHPPLGRKCDQCENYPWKSG